MTTTRTLDPAPGVTLEARWDVPQQPVLAVVFCHPHPLQGGTMTAPLMVAVTKVLIAGGAAVLRFNFRGVGNSTGAHDDGTGEQDDIASAVDLALGEHGALPLAITGWSFGAATALRWQARAGSTIPYAGIAPPLSPDHSSGLPAAADLAPADRVVIMGDRDQFTSIEEAKTYTTSIGADLTVIKGSDHFFHFREQRVGAAVLAVAGAQQPSPGQ